MANEPTLSRPRQGSSLFPDTYAATNPDRPAYIMAATGRKVSYREMVSASRKIARMLWSRGLRHGDRAAILMENDEYLLKVSWACQRLGLRYVAVSNRMTAAEIAYILDDAGAQVLFASAALSELAASAAELASGVTMRFTTEGSAAGFETLDEALSAATDVAPDECEGADLLYSSGTTGKPKGVVASLTMGPLGTPPGFATLFHDLWGIDSDTVYLSPAPLYHAAPLRVCMTVHRFGGTVVVMEKFDAQRSLELIEKYRVTAVQLVPTMMIRILKLADEDRLSFDVSSLRCLIHAAAPCPPDIKRRMIDWLGPIVREFYSSTENYLFTEIGTADWLAHPGSVGRPLVGNVHILDDSGNELTPGQTGTIWSEGGHDFQYLNDPEKTAAARNEHGWTTVGDMGYVDDDGYLYLSDRRSDLILAGGVNVYPQEAENALTEHPDVDDAAVFGIPHDEMGEVVHGVVKVRSGLALGPELEERLLKYCRQRLTAFKCPRHLDFADQLPRTATGKLLRRVLRDQYSQDCHEVRDLTPSGYAAPSTP